MNSYDGPGIITLECTPSTASPPIGNSPFTINTHSSPRMTDCTSSLTRAPAPTSNLFQSATTTLTSPTWRFGPMQPYCSLGATVLGATIDFDPYSDQGHGNHKLDHRAQL